MTSVGVDRIGPLGNALRPLASPGRPAPALSVFVLLTSIVMLAAATPAAALTSEQALGRKVLAELRSAGGSSGAWVADAEGRPLVSLRPEARRTPASVQ